MSELSRFNIGSAKFMKGLSAKTINLNNSVKESWAEIVGEHVAKNSKPVKFSKNILYIAVNNSSWLNQLPFLKEDIINKYNSRFRFQILNDIIFFINRYPDENDSNYYQKKKKNKEKDNFVILNKEISKEDKNLIEKNTSDIEDEYLKGMVAKFFEIARKRELVLLENGWKKCKLCKCLHKEIHNLCRPCQIKEGNP